MSIPELLVRAIAVVALVAAVVLAVLYVAQRSLIYFPGSTSPDKELLPADAEVVEFAHRRWPAPVGLVPAGRRSPSRSGADPTPGPAVLICNGNAGDRSHRLPLAEALTERGYAVLLFDYRGYRR